MSARQVPGKVKSDETLPPGGYWHKRLARGSVLRIVDLEGQQAVDTVIYDAERTEYATTPPTP